MTWLPACIIAVDVAANAPGAIDPAGYDTSRLSYLREFFEAIIRVRAGDTRMARLIGAEELVALYATMSTTDVCANLSALNLALAPTDRLRNPAETWGSEPAWRPLAVTQQYAAVTESLCTYADLVVTYAGTLEELRTCREVIEGVIALACQDARRDYLRAYNHPELTRFSQQEPHLLLEAYTLVCTQMAHLGLDERVNLAPFLGL